MPKDLRSSLQYEPVELQFGTSGRRGLLIHLTQLEVYINVLAEIRYLQSLDRAAGGILKGDALYLAHDLRPSAIQLFAAIEQAVLDAGMVPINMGAIPTPALMDYSLSQGKASIMVTGSHIPFDRNGYKLNTSRGELLKQHEEPIGGMVAEVRSSIYAQPFEASIFNEQGMLLDARQEFPPPLPDARNLYISRYREFFADESLSGKRILVYQHSAVGRDLLVETLPSFGAEVIPSGRSDEFVPIDTENIDAVQLAIIQTLADDAAAKHGTPDAIVSTDGDSDRPLILGLDNGAVRFFNGDLLGMITAEYLGADSVVVPISCNDAIDRGVLAPVVEAKTRIGSPFVIAGMQEGVGRGRKVVCGWEANGGFLTGSDIERHGNVLTALPTRDAILPILCVLFAAARTNIGLPALFAALPRRYSRAALLKQFPRSTSRRIVANFGQREKLEPFFTPEGGFAAIRGIDHTDGVRISFANSDVVHFRPSGNADEFRCYAVADTEDRAASIVQMAIAEPDGILRRLEKSVPA